MPWPERLYTTLVLFGRETKASVASPDTFRRVTDVVAGLLGLASPALKARGWVDAATAKNVTPRKGIWTEAMRERYVQSLASGRFRRIELFEASWPPDRPPDAYGEVHKHWQTLPGGAISERTSIGAENNITIALRDDFVEDARGRLKAAAKALIPLIDCFYGTIESPVPWDRPFGTSSGREDMIDYRYHNRIRNDYRNGTYRMADGVPRLYRGNLLSPSQLTGADPQGMLGIPGVAAVEAWPQGLTYVELADEPPYPSAPPPELEKYVRFVRD